VTARGFTICPSRVAVWLTALVVVLVALGTMARLVIYQVLPSPDHEVARLMHRLDLGFEPSLANWYSSVAMLACAGLILVIAVHKRRSGESYAAHWYGFSGLMLLLAVDENVMLHELANRTLNQWLGGRGILHYTWVVPGALFTLLVTLLYLGFLRHFGPRMRWLLISSGAVFVSGALGMEMVEGVLVEEYGLADLRFTLALAIEEGLEMLGIVLLVYSLLDYIERHLGSVSIRVSASR